MAYRPLPSAATDATRAPSSPAIGTAGGLAPPVREMKSSAPPRVTTKAISRYSSTPSALPGAGRPASSATAAP